MKRRELIKRAAVIPFAFGLPFEDWFGFLQTSNASACEESQSAIAEGIEGRKAHLRPSNATDGLTMKSVGEVIPNSPHTIWQLLCHVNFWQERFLELIHDYKMKPVPHADDGWVKETAPANEQELKKQIEKLRSSIEEAKSILQDATKHKLTEARANYGSGFNVLRAMGNHISYHVGQIMLLRRIVGNYPPPSGGDTW